MANAQLEVTWPKPGDILNRHDGKQDDGRLLVTVTGKAPVGEIVSVSANGASAGEVRRSGDSFEAVVPISAQRSDISVKAGTSSLSIPVLWDAKSFPRYRFSIDDNILFLKDIALGDYKSIFDHWYLKFWRGIHQRYGTKVHVNIYYQTDPSVYADHWDISQFPDKYRSEFRDNADWLHFTFHAKQNKPDRPYKEAGYDEVAGDYDRVTEQIDRFAGPEVRSTYTTVHWAEATREGVQALKDRGMKGLIGLFTQMRGSLSHTGYYLTPEQAMNVAGREAWWDPDMDMIYLSCDMVVNSYKNDEIVPLLNKVGDNVHTAEILELLIHEQYFREELAIFQPDVRQKVITAVEWAVDRGYKPVFWGDGFIGT